MSENVTDAPEAKKHWLDEPRNVDKVYRGLLIFCGVLFVVDVALYLYSRTNPEFEYLHGHFQFDGWPLFHAAFGFVIFILIVLAGKHLRKVLRREEGYYDS